jgi:hypothetical protein
MKIGNSLDRIRIASSCPVSWERMTGDARVRFCDECNLHVYNIGEMTRAEAETLFANTEGRLCARVYRRADGTVITRDCPVGLRAIRRRAAKTAGAVFAAVMALATSVFGQKPGSKDKDSCRQQVTMAREATQVQNGLSTFTGTILDANGAVIAGAKITITPESPARPSNISSDESGSFLLTGLYSGTYTVTVESPGFKKLQLTSVHLASNEKLNLEVTMLIDREALTGIIVLGSTPLIDSPPGTLIINQKMIQSLPIHEN